MTQERGGRVCHQHLGGAGWGKGLAVPAFTRLGASTQPGSPARCSPSTKTAAGKKQNKKPTTHRWLRLWKALKEGLLPAPAARVPARCLLLPARLSLLAAVSHVRLPAHGRLAAPCRLLLASASSPLPWQLGPASSTQSPRHGGALPAAGEDGGGSRCDPERGD